MRGDRRFAGTVAALAAALTANGCAILADADAWPDERLGNSTGAHGGGGAGAAGGTGGGGEATGGSAGGAGGIGTGGTGGAQCPSTDACDTPEDEDCDGVINNGCAPVVYGMTPVPDVGYYPDDLHGPDIFTWGQLLDGAVGGNDYYADLGNGPAYEWVGWYSSTFIELDFVTPREVDSVTIGVNRNSALGIEPPMEIVVSVWDPETGYHPKGSAYNIMVTDAARSEVTVTFQKVLAEWLAITLNQKPVCWLLADEITVGP